MHTQFGIGLVEDKHGSEFYEKCSNFKIFLKNSKEDANNFDIFIK